MIISLGNINNIMIPNHKGVLIIDTPAGMRGKELKSYVRHAQTIIIPVLPSPIDMRATARFIESVLLLGKGHETGIMYKGEEIEWDEERMVREYLKKAGY